ncbi:MAG: hypothetical protein ACJAQT_004573 [Akkermansiaceae bacterium]|jgi:hypothetical protein
MSWNLSGAERAWTYLVVRERGLGNLGVMKKMMRWIMLAAAPVLLVAPVLGQEKAATPAAKTVEANKPTVTFYYFDG